MSFKVILVCPLTFGGGGGGVGFLGFGLGVGSKQKKKILFHVLFYQTFIHILPLAFSYLSMLYVLHLNHLNRIK